MPTYTYECSKCKEVWDDFLSISKMDEPCQAPCPKCEEGPVERVMYESSKIVAGVAIRDKIPADYRTMYNRIKKANIGNKMRTI